MKDDVVSKKSKTLSEDILSGKYTKEDILSGRYTGDDRLLPRNVLYFCIKNILVILCLLTLPFGYIVYNRIYDNHEKNVAVLPSVQPVHLSKESHQPAGEVAYFQQTNSTGEESTEKVSEKTEKGEVVKKVGDPEVLKMWDSGEVLTERKILYEGGKEESIKTITIWNSVPVLVKEEYEKSGKITDGEHISHLISVTGRTTLVTQSEDKVLCLALSGITKPVEDQLDQISEEWNIKEEYIGKMVSVKGYGFKQTETIDRTGKVTSNDGPVKIRIKDHHVTCDELYHLLIDQIDFQ